LRARLEQPQPFFELPVAILQLLILAGQLPQLILELLMRIAGSSSSDCAASVVPGPVAQRLVAAMPANQRQHRRHCRDAGNSMKSG